VGIPDDPQVPQGEESRQIINPYDPADGAAIAAPSFVCRPFIRGVPKTLFRHAEKTAAREGQPFCFIHFHYLIKCRHIRSVCIESETSIRFSRKGDEQPMTAGGGNIIGCA
jgi:hypothetical protein